MTSRGHRRGAASGKRTADALREATRRQRDALDELLQAAKGLLSSDGHPLTAPTLERVADTLRAASIDQASRRQVADGCLAQELRFAGMGIGDLAALPAESPPAPATKPKRRQDEAQQRAQAARDAEAARERNAALTAARKTEAKARRAATRAEKELAAAQARHAQAAASLEEAEQLLATATKRAEETAADLEEAERSLTDLKDG